MVLDMRLEVVAQSQSGDSTLYKAMNMAYAGATTGAAHVAYLETPCSYCRLKTECGPDNEINP